MELMRNRVEDEILGYLDNKHRFLNTKSGKVIVETISERSLQEWAAEYYNTVLIDAKYEGHESSIGLGIMRIQAKDSLTTRACKNFYNKFVLAAQRKFQKKGVSKGSSDGFLFYKGGVVCLEFKVDKNKQQEAQEAFAAIMAALGHPTEVPRTQEDVIAIPAKYGIKTRVYGQ